MIFSNSRFSSGFPILHISQAVEASSNISDALSGKVRIVSLNVAKESSACFCSSTKAFLRSLYVVRSEAGPEQAGHRRTHHEDAVVLWLQTRTVKIAFVKGGQEGVID